MSMTSTAFTGAKLQSRTAQVQVRSRSVMVCRAQNNQVLGAAALAAALAFAPMAHADLTSDLLAKSTANADLHNKQRLAASYANFARSRTVTDGTCKFPGNVLGCDVGAYAGDVAYIADEINIQCQDKEAGKCAEKVSIPQRNQ